MLLSFIKNSVRNDKDEGPTHSIQPSYKVYTKELEPVDTVVEILLRLTTRTTTYTFQLQNLVKFGITEVEQIESSSL